MSFEKGFDETYKNEDSTKLKNKIMRRFLKNGSGGCTGFFFLLNRVVALHLK